MNTMPASPRSVIVADPDPAWPAEFSRVEADLRTCVGGAAIAIDHIGSTAVPGLAAKPVIDVLLRVVDIERVNDEFDRSLTAASFIPHGTFDSRGRRFFVRETNGPRLRVHLHVFPLWHHAASDHLRFRDYLRANRPQAARYGLLKYQLAAAYPDDIEAYMAGKADLMHKLVGQARRYYANV